MKTLFLSSSLIAVLFLGVNAQATERAAKIYDISDISELVVESSVHVDVIQDNTESLRLEADKDFIEKVGVDLSGNKLTLGVKRPGSFSWIHYNWPGNIGQINFTLHVKNLKRVELSGASYANLNNFAEKNVSVYLSGSSHLQANNLHIDDFYTELSGASHTDFNQLIAIKAQIKLSGASHGKVNQTSETEILKVNLSGASHFEGKLLKSLVANAEASGASHMEIWAVDSLDAEASGASHINYVGQPKTRINSSGASHISSETN